MWHEIDKYVESERTEKSQGKHHTTPITTLRRTLVRLNCNRLAPNTAFRNKRCRDAMHLRRLRHMLYTQAVLMELHRYYFSPL